MSRRSLRWRAILLAFAFAAAACSDPVDPDVSPCEKGSFWNGSACVAYAVRTTLSIPTPWTENAQSVALEMIAYTPLEAGPRPALVFHHGSTGNGDNSALFGQTYEHEGLARFFVERGWMVLFPQRRGRGKSGGIYDEGFTPDRSRYSCQADPALAGLEHALQDADVITTFVLSMNDVDPSRLLIGGISRGGILATAHAQRRPSVYGGVVNFVGGWLGEACIDAVTVNRSTFQQAAGQRSSVLFLYGENDPFYTPAHSRANFDAFVNAGGIGSFQLYRRSDAAANGHFIINEPALWRDDLDQFVGAIVWSARPALTRDLGVGVASFIDRPRS